MEVLCVRDTTSFLLPLMLQWLEAAVPLAVLFVLSLGNLLPRKQKVKTLLWRKTYWACFSDMFLVRVNQLLLQKLQHDRDHEHVTHVTPVRSESSAEGADRDTFCWSPFQRSVLKHCCSDPTFTARVKRRAWPDRLGARAPSRTCNWYVMMFCCVSLAVLPYYHEHMMAPAEGVSGSDS